MGRNDDTYSDEEVALILRKATELAPRLSEVPHGGDRLSLDEIKTAAAEVGIDPSLIERAARLLPRRRSESLFDWLIGGPIRHRVDAHFPINLTEARATSVLSAVRMQVEQAGSGEADRSGMSWHSEPGFRRVSVTANAEDDGTGVRVSVDRSAALIPIAIFSVVALVAWSLMLAESIETLGDLLAGFLIPLAGLAVVRTLLVRSTRAIQERSDELLATVERVLVDSGDAGGDDDAGAGQE